MFFRYALRAVALAAIPALALFLAGCGKGNKNNSAPKPPETSQGQGAQAESVPQKPKKPVVEDREEGSLTGKIQVRPSEFGEAPPKVEEDASNIVVDKKAPANDDSSADAGSSKDGKRKKGWSKESEAPAESMASALQSRGLSINWQPKWRFSGVGGVWLPDMQASPDSSLVAFVETTGKDEGPYGSRVVLLNAHSWKIAKIVDVPERKIDKICFVPGSSLMACLCDKQAELKQPYGLALLSLEDGSMKGFNPAIKKKGAALCADSAGNVYATCEGTKAVFVFESSGIEKEPKRVQSLNSGACLALSPDFQTLACAGDKKLEVFKTPEMRPLFTAELPEGFTAGSAFFAGESGNLMLGPHPDKDGGAFILRGRLFRKLADGSSGIFSFNQADNIAYAGVKVGAQLLPFSLPSLEESAPVSPESVSPHTAGSPVKAVFLPPANALAVLDAKGNFFLLHKGLKDKRWQKDLVFAPLMK